MIRTGERLTWGLTIDTPSLAAWGARALWDGYIIRQPALTRMGKKSRTKMDTTTSIDLVWDRQDSRGEESDRKLLSAWINEKGLPALRKLVVSEDLRTSEQRQLVVFENEYRLIANPNASYGYLYLCGMMIQTAKLLRERQGESLVGKLVRTIAMGDWPGGIARVLDLGHDPAAPEIVMNVESTKGHGQIGVFEYEPIELLPEPTIDRDKIQNALTCVHVNEGRVGRVQAIHEARIVLELNDAELAILLSTTNVSASELPAKGERK